VNLENQIHLLLYQKAHQLLVDVAVVLAHAQAVLVHPHDHPGNISRSSVVYSLRNPLVVFVCVSVKIVFPFYGQVGRDHDEPGKAPVIEVILLWIIADRVHPIGQTGRKLAVVTISSEVVLVVASYELEREAIANPGANVIAPDGL
jgi:hypothetical protein